MTVKCLAAGNLFGYFMSPFNYKGEQRTLEPRWLGNEPVAAMNFLRRIAPPHVKKDKKRRWVGHCRRNMTHLIVGFKEGHREVDWALSCAVSAAECLVLAGLPRTSLEFAWCYHPQPENAHLHCGLMRSLLPSGGPYAPKLPFGLAVDFSWLVSWRLDLARPISRNRARLVHGSEFSYKNENRECIKRICQMTQERFLKVSGHKPRLSTHYDFLDLLKEHGDEFGIKEVLVVPNQNGHPVRLTSTTIGRVYRRSVAVQGPENIIWLQGPLCQPDFNLTLWEERMEACERHFASPEMVFERFRHRINSRINDQRARYRISRSTPEVVAEQHFEWLNPKGSLGPNPIQVASPDLLGLDMPLSRFSFDQPNDGQFLREFIQYGPDCAYPFLTDPTDLLLEKSGAPRTQADHVHHHPHALPESEQADITALPDGFDEFPDDDLEEGCFWPFPTWERLIVVDCKPPSPAGAEGNVPGAEPEIIQSTGEVPAPVDKEISPGPAAGSPVIAPVSKTEEIQKTKTDHESKIQSLPVSTLQQQEQLRQDQLLRKKQLWRRKMQLEISEEKALERERAYRIACLRSEQIKQDNQNSHKPEPPKSGGPGIDIQ